MKYLTGIKRISKMAVAVVLVAILLMASTVQTKAETRPPDIRIGVVPSAKQITVGSEGSFSIRDKVTGEEWFTGDNSSVDIQLVSEGIIQTNYRLQVAYTTNDAYVKDWLLRAGIAGYPTYVEPYLSGYRLFIGEFPSDASWSIRVAFKNKMISLGLAGSDAFWKLVTVTQGESTIEITKDGNTVRTSNPITITSDSNTVFIGGKSYRGKGEIVFNSNGLLAGVNVLPVEQYLYGVVPRELPPIPYGEMEAQKAQAIAARTYALANLGKRSSDGFDLLPTPSDQVYGGIQAEHPISNKAVDETKGIVATFEGKLINAVFSSTSGGFTANNEDTWNSDPVPYLRGVPDAERGKALDRVPSLEVFKNQSNSTSLRAAKEGDYESDWSKYHRWNFEWTSKEISAVLSDYFSTDVGKVKEIKVIKRSDSGRVLEIEYITENGTFKEVKDRIRWSLKFVDSSGNYRVLLSTLFFIEPNMDPKTKDVIGFKVYGGGWGHGVGLAQTGAVGMAEKGYTYDEILKHYYQGIDLERKY